eukprot:COSAG04_NODE_3489_length_2775_cov_1.885650_3_plen_397_part_00
MDGADQRLDGGDAVADGDAAPDKHSAFMQQRMAVWQPLMRPKFVIPWFILTGAGLLAAGLAILAAQSGLKSHGPIVYSSIANCSAALRNSPCSNQLDTSYGPNVGPDALKPLNPLCVPLGFDDDPTPTTGAESNVCRLEITLEGDWEGPVYLYYILTNFYQNHRLYVADRADNQLTGENSPSSGVMFTDLLSDLPYQGCTADALPGALFCTGTDDSAWLPVSYANSMGLSKEACEEGGALPDSPFFLCTALFLIRPRCTAGHIPPVDNLPASSGVWCACQDGVWSANATGAPCSGLSAELYNNSKLSPPAPGQNCTQPEEYGDYGEIPSRGGQCWAQFCNPCGRMARSFCTAHPALHSRNATRLHSDTLMRSHGQVQAPICKRQRGIYGGRSAVPR